MEKNSNSPTLEEDSKSSVNQTGTLAINISSPINHHPIVHEDYSILDKINKKCELERMIKLVKSLDLSAANQLYIISRVVEHLRQVIKRGKSLSRSYTIFNSINVSGNVFLPALLTLSSTDSSYHDYCFWAGFGISLLTGFSTALSAFFQINKKYFLIQKSTDEVRHDFYTYVSLSDHYKEFASHRDAFSRFSKNVESTMAKMSRKEFSSGGTTGKNGGSGTISPSDKRKR
jgi:hypothetical protein